MRTRLVLGGLAAALALALPSPAFALHKDEVATSGNTTATFSYDYKKSRYGIYDVEALHMAIDRAGQRLFDQDLATNCAGSCDWPAAIGAEGVQSVTVRDLDGDGEPEVLVDFFTGGANCCFYSESWRYDEATNTYIQEHLQPTGLSFEYVLKDLNHDGVPEFRSLDYRFAYKYGSNVDTPRPLRIYDWDAGKLVDVTLAYPKLAAREAASLYRLYLNFRKQKNINLRGILAAYLADSYNARNGRAAWRRVVAAYRRGELKKPAPDEAGPWGKAFLKSVRVFLKKTGYLRRV